MTFLTNIVQSARKKLTSFDDLLFLAEISLLQLNDPDTAEKIYAEAEEKAQSNNMLSKLATSLSNRMDDPKWSSRVLRKIK